MQKTSGTAKQRQLRLQKKRARKARLRKIWRGHLKVLRDDAARRERDREPTAPAAPPTPQNKVKFPEVLDLQTNRDECLRFVAKLKETILEGRRLQTFLDLSNIQKVEPAAALIVLAEIDRCIALLANSKRRSVTGNRPTNRVVLEILDGLGYFEHFGFGAQTSGSKDNVFVKVTSDLKTNTKFADALISAFEKSSAFKPYLRKKLIEALVECMDNVRKHAYLEDFWRDVTGKWWMMGIEKPLAQEVEFYFFDQGAGIPGTLRHKFRELFTLDHEFVEEAVLEGRTRLDDDPRRGNGLPSLLRVLNFGPGGELRIYSGRANTLFKRNRDDNKFSNSDMPLRGTLICWRLSASGSRDVGPLN